MKPLIFVVNAGTYNYDIVCAFTKDVNHVIHKMKYNLTVRESMDLYDYKLKKGMAVTFENVSLIWLPEKPKNLEQLGHLSHEIWHVADEILRRVGIKLSVNSTEAYAYLIEYISVQVWKKLKFTIK